MQTQNVTLDFCRNNYKDVTVKQYDKDSRNVLIKCTDNGYIYKLDSSIHSCNLKMNTPDNRAIYNPATITEDGKVLVVFNENMVHASGTGKLEIQVIEKSTQRTLSSMILTVIIVGSVYSDDKIIASDEFNVLTETLLKIDDAAETAAQAVSDATVATKEANAVIGRVSEAIDKAEEATNDAITATEDLQILETQIADAEILRNSNEATRQENETIRQENEAERQTHTTIAIKNANEATIAANEAASNANKATESVIATINTHDTSATAHNDIRDLIIGLTTRLNILADSDDVTLDQMSELVAYIKSNKSLIEAITTNKINVSDIIDNLTTSVTNKPLSAKQGVELKALIDATSEVLSAVSKVANNANHTATTLQVSVVELKAATNQLSDEIDILKEKDVDLTGYATESYVKEYAQPKGNYLTQHQDLSAYATKQDVSQLSSEIADIPNNELLIQNVAQKVPHVKVAEPPTFVDSVDEMTDISKMYVLKSDGMFYSYKVHTTTTPGGTFPNFTNKMPTSIDESGAIYNGTGYKNNARLSSSGVDKEENYNTAFGYIPVKGGDTIRFKSVSKNGADVIWYDTTKNVNYICAYDANFKLLYTGNSAGTYNTSSLVNSMSLDGSASVITLKNVANIAYIRMSVINSYSLNDIIGESAIITVNEEITYTTTEESTTTTYSWESTGISYNQPADYEHRVIAMEKELEVLLNGTF